MRAFSQGHIDGRDSRCRARADLKGTCVAPVTGLVRRRRLARVRLGGSGISSLPGPFTGDGLRTALIWTPYMTLTSDGPRAPSRRDREFRWRLGSTIVAVNCDLACPEARLAAGFRLCRARTARRGR